MPVGWPLLLRAGSIGVVIPLAVVGFTGYALVFGAPANHIGQQFRTSRRGGTEIKLDEVLCLK
jgi:hypothetical protein